LAIGVPPGMGGASATSATVGAGVYFGGGAAVGAAHGYADAIAATNGEAGWGAVAFATGAGALAGGFSPVGEFVSATAAIAGGYGQWMGGGSFLGNGFMAGGLVGSVAGGFGTAVRQGLLQGGARAGLRAGLNASGPEVVGMGIGAGIGGYYGGTEGALFGANMGMFGGGIARGGYGLYGKWRAPGGVQQGYSRVYRAVSEAEYQDILRTGQFRQGPNSLEGKWFADSLEGAQAHGNSLFGIGNFRLIEADVPNNAPSLFQQPNLDGLGPARYLHLDDLNGVTPQPVR